MQPAKSATAPRFTETTSTFVAGTAVLSLLVLVLLLVLVIGPPGVG